MIPAFQMLAAVAVARTLMPSLRMAPAPTKPMPVMSPCMRREGAAASGEPATIKRKPQLAMPTIGKVRIPAVCYSRSRSQPITAVSE